jgi:hypothetical protein
MVDGRADLLADCRMSVAAVPFTLLAIMPTNHRLQNLT